MDKNRDMDRKPGTYAEAKGQLDAAWDEAKKAKKRSKSEADELHRQARKAAGNDKDVAKRADEQHKVALEDANKAYDATTTRAHAAFTDFWRQQDEDTQTAATQAKEQGDAAQKTLTEAKAQADAEYKQASSQGMDSQARKEADSARKEAHKQAKRDYDQSMRK